MYMGVARVDPFVIGVRKTCPWYDAPIQGTVLCTWVWLEYAPL